MSESISSSHSTKPLTAARVLLPLGLGTALSLMGDATLYTVLPTHTADAGVTLAQAGILLGVNRAIRLFLNGPAGLAYDKWPHRRLFILSLCIGALSTAIYAATHGFWPLFVGRLLWGLAWSGIWVGGSTIILKIASPQERGRWTGLYQTWFFFGGALGTLLGGVLTDWLGYTRTMWVGALITAIGAVAAWLLLPETENHQVTPTSDTSPSTTKSMPSRLRINGPLGLILILQGLIRFVVSGVMAATLALLVQDYFPPETVVLGTATLTGILSASRTLLSMLSAPVTGNLSDRVHNRWYVVVIALIATVVGLVLAALTNPLSLIAGIAIIAISRSSIRTLTSSLVGDLSSDAQRGRVVGLLNIASDFGSAIGPSIAYLLLPWLGIQGTYLLCAGLFAASVVPTLTIAKSETLRLHRTVQSHGTEADLN